MISSELHGTATICISSQAAGNTPLYWAQCTTIGDHGMVKQSFDSQMHKSNFMQVCVYLCSAAPFTSHIERLIDSIVI